VKAQIIRSARTAVGIAAVLPLAGCITVRPPDKPIEVNLNVNIKQEVLVRLQQDVQQMIQKNPQAFPPPPTTKKP
jgi:YnbE-like lipoprotein